MVAAWGSTVTAILDTLSLDGPMTCEELADAIDVTGDKLRGVVSRLHRNKRLHIAAWRDTPAADGGRRYLRAVYALGAGDDKRKPRRATNAAAAKRHRAGLRVASSVFDLGLGAAELQAKNRLIKGMMK